MNTLLPSIYRDCRRLLVFTEEMFRSLSRYHRTTAGINLCQAVIALIRNAVTPTG